MKNLPDLFRDSFGRNLFRDMARIQRQMDQIFGLSGPLTVDYEPIRWSEPRFAPSCDVEETATHYLMTFDFPGVKKEDVKVELIENKLTVSGERKEEKKVDQKSRYQMERLYGSFERSFTLPNGIKAEQVETEYADGVLSIAIPKTEAAKAQQIKIGEQKPGFREKFLGQKKDEKKNPEKKAFEKVAY